MVGAVVAVLAGGFSTCIWPLEGSPDDRETPAWLVHDPDSFGLETSALERAFRHASTLERVNSLLVARRGTLVAEEYFKGLEPDEKINIKSASKSIISALVGIAIDEGIFTGVDQPMLEAFPSYAPDSDSRSRLAPITIEHMLTMTTGLEPTSSENYGRWVASEDWVDYALSQPREDLPGGKLLYSTGTTHVLGVMLAEAAGTDLHSYAQERFFAPLDIEIGPWDRDPQGNYLGGNNMQLTPREMIRIGQLYLDGGRYEGTQVLPEDWVEASLKGHVWHPEHEIWYGYYWWTDTFDDYLVHYAWGYGGQFIYLFPELEMVVVTTSELVYDPNDNYEHIDRLHEMVRDYVLPAVERPPLAGGSEVSGD